MLKHILLNVLPLTLQKTALQWAQQNGMFELEEHVKIHLAVVRHVAIFPKWKFTE
jgi:hypothetical protein